MAGEISLEDQIAEVDRELQFRERVYPRWVNSKQPRLTLAGAQIHMERMRAVRASLVDLQRQRDSGQRALLPGD